MLDALATALCSKLCRHNLYESILNGQVESVQTSPIFHLLIEINTLNTIEASVSGMRRSNVCARANVLITG